MSIQTKFRIGVVGCGDVAYRNYFPALALLADRLEVAGCVASSAASAQKAADSVRSWSPDACAYTDLARMLAEARLDAAINLTPAPLHTKVNQACLDAGVNVYSEKPLAGTVSEADGLIETAARRKLLLMCAPGVAATRRFRWLSEIVASGRFGRPTLAVGQFAGWGPAGWREYTGDPTVFYGPSVGPVFDLGVYRLHAMTMLFGPVRRVQAMGSIAVPLRVVRGGRMAGRTIEVTAPDHVLINLEFASGALGQLLASFATPATQAPWLELHFEKASLSFPGSGHDQNSPVSIFLDDKGAVGVEGWAPGWTHGVQPPPPADPLEVIGTGVTHFVACLRGEEKPLLTAEHARHVLEVILAAYASIADGHTHEMRTTF
jgi:predicted dehydrogenase